MYNAVNFNLCSSGASNLTICGVRNASLICPSDPQNETIRSRRPQPPPRRLARLELQPDRLGRRAATPSSRCPPGTWLQAFTSYAGQCRHVHLRFHEPDAASRRCAHNGVIYNDSKVTIASITDGTSNTFLFGEHSKGTLLHGRPGVRRLRRLVELGTLVRHPLLHAVPAQP